MIVDYRELAPDTLDSLIESFVLREGTDYGEVEYSLAEKVEHVKAQLINEEAFIEYSEEHETVTIVSRNI
ncbi:YheU family protein [Glaciecola siphonariae]|uniref:YheU family protein n=1 Tax=Glaciecola siphonariae TaxID=521012 RepID=A0ABV9LQ90_9ALTE